ncbi:MAG: FimV/HubP family polar landmark protein [Burkholderiaceae bacterium]
MPSNQFRRVPAAAAIALAFGLSVGLGFSMASPAEAAGLGRLNVQSALGQPLRAELEVNSVTPDEAPTLSAKLAPLAAYRAANVDFSPGLTGLRLTLEQRNGTYIVRINSPQPINEPYLDLLVELSWATGRVVREYTILLDPPALRQAPDVIAPATPRGKAPAVPVAAAPMAAVPAPQPAAAKPAAVAKPEAALQTYTVKRGDTLFAIAERNRRPSVSLDQMLVALFHANPGAFVAGNMNRMGAGAVISIPGAAAAAAVTPAEASREVRAQSADFAAYRSRLAKAVAAVPAVAQAAAPAAAASGQVSAKIEDKSTVAKAGGDQLKIAKAQDGKGATAAAAADEVVARTREVNELESRLAQLNKTNDDLKRAIELQSKAGTQAQTQSEAKAPATAALAPEVKKAEPVAPAPTDAAKPATPAPASEAAPSNVAKPEAPPPVAPAPAPAEEGPSFIGELLGNTSTQLGLGGIAVLLAGLFGWSSYRRKKAESKAAYRDSNDGLGANSLFGQTGGQSVDTAGTASTFNSSFMPAAAPLDANEVDPVAEADVYIAYGRDEQAEDILKEALRLQPDRHAARGKLLEIYAHRGDKASFNAVAQELHERSAGMGEEWDAAAKLGRTIDSTNPLYAGAVVTAGLAAAPITQLRIPPEEAVSAPVAQSELSGIVAPTAMPELESDSIVPLTYMAGDSTPLSELAPTTDGAAPDVEPPAEHATPMTVFSIASENEVASAPAAAAAIDFDSLDFDLGPTQQPIAEAMVATVPRETPDDLLLGVPLPEAEPEALRFDLDLDIPSIQPIAASMAPASTPALVEVADLGLSDFEHAMPPLDPQAGPVSSLALDSITEIDLDFEMPSQQPVGAPFRASASAEQILGQPTHAGIMGAVPDELAQRMGAEIDQSTVPLIDFDLSAVNLDASAGKGEAEPGSALAQQMSTKLDLARGYIDLGVRDGARELLDEVMREGTREQRSAAIELIKQIEG